jgi:hypothetical protein
MIRRRNAILLAVGLIAPLALVGSPAGAIDQDLVVSATAGPPGTEVTVSSASCVSPNEGDASLAVSLYTGTAPNQQIAAFSEGYDGTATFTIPDWVDPDQPAVIEASCVIYGEDDVEDLAFDPVEFDVEPGAGTPVQVRTFSRTELLAGQGFTVTGSCGAGLGNGIVQGGVGAGTDQTGKDLGEAVGQGYTQINADGTFELEIYVTNAYVSLGIETDGDQVSGVEVDEVPLEVPAGDYTAFVYCSDENANSLQFLEPQALVVTGSAPTDGIDLTAATNTADVTIAGTCTEGDITGGFEGMALEDIIGDFDQPLDVARTNRFATARSSAPASSVTARRAAGAHLVRSGDGASRALAGDGYSEFEGTPGADGSWQVTENAGFDEGIVIGIAFCGDPMADGYFYDPQGVEVAVVEAPPTTSTTTTTTAPKATPANAVAGTPDYAG